MLSSIQLTISPPNGKFSPMFERNITQHILDALSDTPVVFLRGARQTGKSTLVRAIAAGPYSSHYVTLDNAGVLASAGADPTGFISGLEKPVVLDEAHRKKIHPGHSHPYG
jgi:predicted AAA+ superfamily ATPase